MNLKILYKQRFNFIIFLVLFGCDYGHNFDITTTFFAKKSNLTIEVHSTGFVPARNDHGYGIANGKLYGMNHFKDTLFFSINEELCIENLIYKNEVLEISNEKSFRKTLETLFADLEYSKKEFHALEELIYATCYGRKGAERNGFYQGIEISNTTIISISHDGDSTNHK
ncbi:MAG: hypothetical protein HN704_10140 [Bacteroidetes bacterium]|jgi:hypothetical protein|nr:hypothetical protein [Bacteroidota bacterium]MBT7141714.1 hypothetical protein [Bacteroidota bacterium]MBT7491951.1 hypothetical protein [Bacteroidota bacterium]